MIEFEVLLRNWSSTKRLLVFRFHNSNEIHRQCFKFRGRVQITSKQRSLNYLRQSKSPNSLKTHVGLHKPWQPVISVQYYKYENLLVLGLQLYQTITKSVTDLAVWSRDRSVTAAWEVTPPQLFVYWIDSIDLLHYTSVSVTVRSMYVPKWFI